jgi:hypothetical protein
MEDHELLESFKNPSFDVQVKHKRHFKEKKNISILNSLVFFPNLQDLLLFPFILFIDFFLLGGIKLQQNR